MSLEALIADLDEYVDELVAKKAKVSADTTESFGTSNYRENHRQAMLLRGIIDDLKNIAGAYSTTSPRQALTDWAVELECSRGFGERLARDVHARLGSVEGDAALDTLFRNWASTWRDVGTASGAWIADEIETRLGPAPEPSTGMSTEELEHLRTHIEQYRRDVADAAIDGGNVPVLTNDGIDMVTEVIDEALKTRRGDIR